MNGWTLFQTLGQEIQQPLLAMVDVMIAGLTGPVGQVVRVGVVVMIGWFMLKGVVTGGGNPWSDFERKLLLGGAVYLLCSQAANYHQWVADLFLQRMGQEITALIGGGGGQPITGKSFDDVWNTAYVAGLAVYKQLDWTDIGLQLLVVIFWVVSLLAIGLGFLIWMTSFVLLTLFIGTGPIFAACFAFPFVKSIAERWFGAMIAAVILQVFVVALLTILTKTEVAMIGQIASAGSGNAVQQLQLLLGGLALFFVCGLILLQLPAAASSLSGGLAFQTGGIVAGAAAAVAGAGAATGAAVSGIAAGGHAASNAILGSSGGASRAPAGRSLSS